MKPSLSPGGACTDPDTAPIEVRVLRTLGHGRAARAQLVDAVMPNGQTLRCVEKVFAPGLLTRTIYRLSFQSPFAYQSNRDAILACFYRRRVAAMVLEASEIDASIASPLYVRFDQPSRAWVLAAEWIDGRGIQPGPTDGSRVRRWLTSRSSGVEQPSHEIDVLVDTMQRLETMFSECGLVGSGWQVAPRALVSTANLLRCQDRYTVIDLESGIPAVLVPRYLLAGARRATLPPFDDLDADQLRSWINQNERLLTFRAGPEMVERLRQDSERLIDHSMRWKNAEFALLRRPWRLLTRAGSNAYQTECFRRWEQDGIIDRDSAASLANRPIKSRLIWCAGLVPSSLGRLLGRMIGRRDVRQRVVDFLRDSEVRAGAWRTALGESQQQLVAAERIPVRIQLNRASFFLHKSLACLPARLHRFIVDSQRRKEVANGCLLLLFSGRYQSWFGQRRIEAAIDRWQNAQRIDQQSADRLRDSLSGHEVRAYVRGFGMHVALKALAPVIAPAKVGGIAAFVASGNPWFLLPLLSTPVLRTTVTLINWWSTRHQHIPHAEALATGWLPFIGAVAFPLQMFAARPELSTFLIRDAAAALGRRIPIYGGADSRTEIACIRGTDFVVEFMQSISLMTQRLFRWEREAPEPATVLKIRSRTRFGKWIDRQAERRIAAAEQAEQDGVGVNVVVAERQASSGSRKSA